jgi:hypothetical protein
LWFDVEVLQVGVEARVARPKDFLVDFDAALGDRIGLLNQRQGNESQTVKFKFNKQQTEMK